MSFKNHIKKPTCFLYKATKPIQKNLYCKTNYDFTIKEYCNVN